MAVESIAGVSAPEAARELGVSYMTLLRWIRGGQIPATNLAGNANGKRPRWRISRQSLADFLKRRASGVALI